MDHPAQVDQALNLAPEQAIKALGSLPENQWFERKSGRIKPRDLANPIVAMANAEGGYVFVGYTDGKPDPVPETRVNDFRQVSIDFTSPAVRAHVQELRDPEAEGVFLLLRVDPGEHVHETASGDCYLRVGDESKKLSFAQRQELEFDRGAAPYDGRPVDVEVAELSGAQADAYRGAIGSESVERMLRARSLVTRSGRLTVAGYLLFADRPQDLLPNAYVRVLKYADAERGTGARLSLMDGHDVACEGSIPKQILDAAKIIDEFIPKRRVLTADGRFDAVPVVPRDAWLEGLVNAVVHRSYSLAGDHTRVEIYPDRIEITSPGRFPGLVDPSQPLSISRHARNPRIARVCADLGIAQELGEGIKRMFEEMRRRGLTDPMYSQSAAAVRLVLSVADAIPPEIRAALTKSSTRILDAMRRAGRPLGTGQIAELADVARPTAIRSLRSLEQIGLVSWSGASERDPRAVWVLI